MTIDDHGFTLEFEEKNIEQADIFFKFYRLSNIDFALSEPINDLPQPSPKTCRYCGNSIPKVTFNKKAHTIPEFLGNKDSVSDFECDSCNIKFARIEQQLSFFIGHYITISGTKGKKGIPNSISHDNKTIARPIKLFNNIDGIEFGNNHSSNERVKYNAEEGYFEVQFKSQPYIPFNVYKSLLKLALGLIPPERVFEFKKGFDILQDKRNRNFVANPSNKLLSYTIDKSYSFTSILLFESIDKSMNVPPLSLVFLYNKFMYQIFIPYSFEFLERMDKDIIFCPYLPPILPSETIKTINTFKEIIDLDSLETQTRNLLTILKADIDIENMIAIDKDTGIEKKYVFDPKNVSQFVLIKKGTTIPIKK